VTQPVRECTVLIGATSYCTVISMRTRANLYQFHWRRRRCNIRSQYMTVEEIVYKTWTHVEITMMWFDKNILKQWNKIYVNGKTFTRHVFYAVIVFANALIGAYAIFEYTFLKKHWLNQKCFCMQLSFLQMRYLVVCMPRGVARDWQHRHPGVSLLTRYWTFRLTSHTRQRTWNCAVRNVYVRRRANQLTLKKRREFVNWMKRPWKRLVIFTPYAERCICQLMIWNLWRYACIWT